VTVRRVARPGSPRAPSSFALGPLLVIAAAVVGVLLVGSGGYGYHRDELYFLAASDHPAWGYADQGPLTPAIAHAMSWMAPGSLRVLRIPSACMIGITALITGTIAFELGGRRRAQLIAASCTAVGSFALFVGHVLSTSTLDFLAWAAVTWLVVRIIRTGHYWLWVAAGGVAGLALLNKPLIAFLLVGLAAGFLATGHRRVFHDYRLWIGMLIALLVWSPWLVWQAMHGWPQLDVSASIASGGSGSSQPRWLLLPFQFLLVSPVLAPVWIAGLGALFFRASLRRFQFIAFAWIVLVIVFLITGGKPYYLAGLFPVLLAAGAIEVDAWLERGSARARMTWLTAAVALSGIVSVVLALPVVPARDAGPVIAANGDVGETIGWPQFVRTIATVYRRADRPAVIFTSNYGEAGAVDRFGPSLGLPRAYSGHNAFANWGSPPDRHGPVVVVGLDTRMLVSHFAGCRLEARVDNAAGVANDERGTRIELCSGTRQPWSRMWPDLRHYD
jgi:4-amino-4-deoxy-L-arabinose transferase-like glycosyltransferase